MTGPGEPDLNPKAKRRFTKADAKLTAFGLLALLAGIFVGQNTGAVPVHFVFVTVKIRLIWVFLLCIAIGIALDRLLTWRGVLPEPKQRRRSDQRGSKNEKTR